MYAVIRTGGKQYKVVVDDVIRVETLPGDKGDPVVLEDVLMLVGEDGLKVGDALESGCQVNGTIIRQLRAKKILVFKKKRRKNYRRKQGHRQNMTELQITGIQASAAPAEVSDDNQEA